MAKISVLIVDDEESVVTLFERLAKKERLSYASARNGYEALGCLSKHEVECLILDINLPSHSGFQILENLSSSQNPVQVVVITGSGSVDHAVKALKMGVFDYMTKPFTDLDKVVATMRNALEKYRLVQKVQELQKPEQMPENFLDLVGRSTAIQEIYQLIQSIKNSSATVLIQGESGTGKEMVAKAIYKTSPRAQKPFKVINCAAIPEGLLESELFGHVKGAFTGALYDKKGLFEEAHGGTIFLDEIGEVTPSFQVKLLRVLQGGEYKRVGSSEMRHTDVRVISATNKDLKTLIAQNKFREDLFYRLHVIGIHLPPLRERPDDIPLLAYHFFNKYKKKTGKEIHEISLDAMQALQNYPWVGNVRELENVMERCVVLAQGNVLRAKDLPPQILTKAFHLEDREEVDLSSYPYKEAKIRALEIFNKNYILHLLQQTGGNISLASDRAGMDRSNFKKILRKYDIDLQEFRRS
jgi:DNA-binding NtrC family response regulator